MVQGPGLGWFLYRTFTIRDKLSLSTPSQWLPTCFSLNDFLFLAITLTELRHDGQIFESKHHCCCNTSVHQLINMPMASNKTLLFGLDCKVMTWNRLFKRSAGYWSIVQLIKSRLDQIRLDLSPHLDFYPLGGSMSFGLHALGRKSFCLHCQSWA